MNCKKIDSKKNNKKTNPLSSLFEVEHFLNRLSNVKNAYFLSKKIINKK